MSRKIRALLARSLLKLLKKIRILRRWWSRVGRSSYFRSFLLREVKNGYYALTGVVMVPKIPSRLRGPMFMDSLCPLLEIRTRLNRRVSLLNIAPRCAPRFNGETLFIIQLDLCTVIPGLVTEVPPVFMVVVNVPRLTRLSIGIMFIICLELALVTRAPNIRRLLKLSPAVVLMLQLLLTRLPERLHLHMRNLMFVPLSRIAVGAEFMFPLRPSPPVTTIASS